MPVSLYIEQIINGLIAGSMYALIGGGIALVYGVTRVLNMAHGEFYMLGGYGVFYLVVAHAVPPVAAIPLVALLLFALGVIVQRLTIHYLLPREGWAFACIAATLGLSIAFQNLALVTFGEDYKAVPYYVDGVLRLGDVRLPLQRALMLAVAVITLLAMAFILKKTRFGWALRAAAQDADAASVCGIPVGRVHMITFGLSAALGAIAAAMLAPIYSVSPWMGLPVLFKGFVVVILGGLGSFPGAIVGGFLLGIVEAIGVQLTSAEWRDAIGFAVMILVVWLRPWGLFGKPQ
ncbi:branched-chain amino acid ABC transporter permease [Terrarubrum flagellatum]|uniref:branched-chain amino acid ABC transporter permease n=1 Tax=Terrirubrum flagellatum TaxID=2895980 RepID=UPI0031451F5B